MSVCRAEALLSVLAPGLSGLLCAACCHCHGSEIDGQWAVEAQPSPFDDLLLQLFPKKEVGGAGPEWANGVGRQVEELR